MWLILHAKALYPSSALTDTVADIYIWRGDNNNNICPNLKCQNLKFEIKFKIFKPVSYPLFSWFLCINTTLMQSFIHIHQPVPIFHISSLKEGVGLVNFHILCSIVNQSHLRLNSGFHCSWWIIYCLQL
jgi:hypothetical protein